MSADKLPTAYLDHAATSPVDERVAAAMLEALQRTFGNPSSRHPVGLAAERLVRTARQRVAARCGVESSQVIFTSGGTEALALGLLGGLRRGGSPAHLLISAVEHAAVRETAKLAQAAGHLVETVPVGPSGWVAPEDLGQRVRPDTALVALMHVNNETGVVQPVAECARQVKARQPRCRLLVDAVQSFTWLPTHLSHLGADLLALSGHKIHGPKGVGALVLAPGVHVAPLWGGGDQEGGRRPGTENVPGIVGLGLAAELATGPTEGVSELADRLARAVQTIAPSAYLLGDRARLAPQIRSVALPGRRAEVLVNALAEAGVFVSSGSACHARQGLRSHVTEAMGVPESHAVLRFSLSRSTTPAEIETACLVLERVLRST
ncbi:MAG: cysteine desulfurase [Deltaproteobacteria bacterium]|nr:cysteine desulfurase [Deltaproteobacteria bacterium]